MAEPPQGPSPLLNLLQLNPHAVPNLRLPRGSNATSPWEYERQLFPPDVRRYVPFAIHANQDFVTDALTNLEDFCIAQPNLCNEDWLLDNIEAYRQQWASRDLGTQRTTQTAFVEDICPPLEEVLRLFQDYDDDFDHRENGLTGIVHIYSSVVWERPPNDDDDPPQSDFLLAQMKRWVVGSRHFPRMRDCAQQGHRFHFNAEVDSVYINHEAIIIKVIR
jgi:hypothetical protein